MEKGEGGIQKNIAEANQKEEYLVAGDYLDFLPSEAEQIKGCLFFML